MTKSYKIVLTSVIALSTLFILPLRAGSCAKCERIEKARAEEQAHSGPQSMHYYDDDFKNQISLVDPVEREQQIKTQQNVTSTAVNRNPSLATQEDREENSSSQLTKKPSYTNDADDMRHNTTQEDEEREEDQDHDDREEDQDNDSRDD